MRIFSWHLYGNPLEVINVIGNVAFSLRAASYGLNVPIEILNQIDYFKEKIEQVEKEIDTLSKK